MTEIGAEQEVDIARWASAPLPRFRPFAALRRALEAERDRWLLWLPMFLGAGIGIYFSLTVEPPLWIGLVAAPLALAGALAARWCERGAAAAIAIAAVAVGFAAAQIETSAVAAPVLAKPLDRVRVEGTVVEVEPLSAGRRILIEPRRIGRLDPTALPARIRITLRKGEAAPMPGASIALTATLHPPSGPAMPGAYDFQRRAYFDRLGAVGYAVGPVRALTEENAGGWRIWIAALRAQMSERILAALPGREGAIAAAIITGETHAIPERDAQAFRDAGLAHILVIAGLHMGLVAGVAFLVLRTGLALIPWVALRFNTKKGAAMLALLVTFAYMLLSGATVSSRRSFFMTALVLLAILVDRLHLSARGLAWAALAILLASPFAAVGPSFQMSFAAVSGLIAFYETFRDRFSAWHHGAGVGRRLALYLLATVCTTMVTTVATAPFTEFHFNRFPVYSAAANAIAVPLTGIWVIPWAMASCALMPFGLEHWGLVPMGWGIEAIAEIALWVTSWPGAAVVLPSMPVWGLMVLSFGGFWLCVWRRRWRLLGLVPLALGCATLLLPRPPDVLVDGDSSAMAVRMADGTYLIEAEKRGGFTTETWVRRGATAAWAAWPRNGVSADGSLTCDIEGCLYRAQGWAVALARDRSALEEDCTRADLVIAPMPSRGVCRETPIIDRFDTWRNGSFAIWLDPGHITVESVRDWRGERPWVPVRGAGGRINTAAATPRAGPAP